MYSDSIYYFEKIIFMLSYKTNIYFFKKLACELYISLLKVDIYIYIYYYFHLRNYKVAGALKIKFTLIKLLLILF